MVSIKAGTSLKSGPGADGSRSSLGPAVQPKAPKIQPRTLLSIPAPGRAFDHSKLVPLPGNLLVDRCTKVQSSPLPCQKLIQSLADRHDCPFSLPGQRFRPVTFVTTSPPYCTSHRFVQQIMRVRGFGWFAMPHLSYRDASFEPKKPHNTHQ
jgi:hypothetical protein